MKPFRFAAPTSVEQAVTVLTRHGSEARPLAGGTDLLAQLQEGRRAAGVVVDLKRIPALMALDFQPDQGLTIGAAVPCHAVYSEPAVREHYPALWAAARIIGSIQIQNRATLGGNLCNGSPSADLVPPLIVLGAEVTVAGPEGRRRLPVEEVPAGPGRTALAPGELAVAFHLPPPARRSGSHYLRFIPRNEMDIAVAGAGAWLRLDPDGRCGGARLALAAVAPVPLRVPAAEAQLVGRVPDADAIAGACEAAVAAARPISDVRGSAAYRRQLVGVLTRRAIETALEQIAARDGSD